MVALVILIIILISLLLFTIRFFDNSDDSFTLQDIQDFKVSIQRFNIENVKEYVVETVRKADLEKIVQGAKYLIMKPKQKINEKIPWKDMVTSTKKEFGIIWNIISHKPLYMNLVWTVSLVLIFGFWDTFASSFLLGFLDDIKHGWSYILLAIIGVP